MLTCSMFVSSPRPQPATQTEVTVVHSSFLGSHYPSSPKRQTVVNFIVYFLPGNKINYENVVY